MVIRKTSKYKLRYFDTGDVYDFDADHFRFQAIENQLDIAMSVTGGGVLKGWEVSQNPDYITNPSKRTSVLVSKGLGIIPFLTDTVVIDEDTNRLDKVFESTKEVHYLGTRTNGEIEIAELGKNRVSVIYIGLSDNIVAILNDKTKREEIIDFTSSSNTQIFVLPAANQSPGLNGPYRNTNPVQSQYPVTEFDIQGDFDSIRNTFTVFVNGKPYYDKYSNEGRRITFEFPLRQEDIVTVRIEPKFSIPIAEVETDDTSVVRIDNSIRPKVNEIEGNSIIYKALVEHLHNGADNNPSKILLTTETGHISSDSSDGNISYTFTKPTSADEYGFDFGIDSETGLSNYTTDVYINGILNVDPVSISDNGTTITATFEDSLEDSDVVTVVLSIKDNYTQVKNKIIINDNNPSQDPIDISLDASKFDSGTLDPNMIPKLSHIGVSREALSPTNPQNGENEYVHRTETRDFQEFFPVYSEKANAREAKDIFSEIKNSSATKRIYACGSNASLYYESLDYSTSNHYIASDEEDKFFSGWNVFDFQRTYGDGGNDRRFNEFDAPFKIVPIKKSSSSNNWDQLFFVGEKFISGIDFVNNALQVREIVNLSSDRNIQETNLHTLITSIVDADVGSGLLNLSRGLFVLSDSGKVLACDFRGGGFNWWDITATPLWTNAYSITNLENANNDLLFVGSDTDSDYDLYLNALGYGKLENLVSPNKNEGRVVVGFTINPTSIWDWSESSKELFASGDDLIISTYNGISAKREIFTISYSPSGTQNNIAFPQGEGVQKPYQGFENSEYNSVILRDWVKVAENLDSPVKRVIFAFDRLFVLTTKKVYATSSTFTSIDDVNYLINQSSVLSPSSGLVELDPALTSGQVFTDFALVGTSIIITGNFGITNLSFNESVPASSTFSESKNSGYVTTINDMLFPAYSIVVDSTISKNDETAFICTKYGIFQTTDAGASWRNTMQLLGSPEDPDSQFTNKKSVVKTIAFNQSQNRIYVSKVFGNEYAYGYGYGYGVGADYFDVFNEPSANYGYGFNTFEQDYAFTYGYGYGYEIINPIEFVEPNDWVFVDQGSGSIYDSIPFKILGTGIENRLYYIDVEQADGYEIDFSELSINQVLNIYSKIEPLALLDDVPQDVNYDSTDIEAYDVDYNRQSISFDNEIDEDKLVTIASQYKEFEAIKSFDETLITDTNVKIDLNGRELARDTDWSYDSESNTYSFSDSSNIDDIFRLTVRGTTITDIGDLDHKDIEDGFSLETTGLEYEFNNVRASNLLNIAMSFNHAYQEGSETDTSTTGTITAIDGNGGGLAPYIEDTSKNFVSGVLVGKNICINSSNCLYRFTIETNTSDRIYILPRKEYEDFSSSADGSTTTFSLQKGQAIDGSVRVYINGVINYDWSTVLSDGLVVSLDFFTAPSSGDHIVVCYIDDSTKVDIDTIAEVGDSYSIIPDSDDPFDFVEDTFISDYRESSSIFDTENSVIENSILVQNAESGESSSVNFYSYFDSLSNKIFAGTNVGVWKRDINCSVYHKTSNLLSTLDATGSISVPNVVNGAYVQFNKDTGEWTITWGGGAVVKDRNLNLDDISIKAVAVSPFDPDVVFVGSQDSVYRSFDGGSNWETVLYGKSVSESASNPIVKDLVFDDKHPWVINAVFEDVLFRSVDYGNNWEEISGYKSDSIEFGGIETFAYQKDNSDTRSVYFYGKNKVYTKNYRTVSPLTILDEKTHNLDRVIDDDNLFGLDYSDSTINSIDNAKSNPNQVFLSIENYGVFKTTLLGNEFNFQKDSNLKSKTYGFISGLENQFTNGNKKIAAFNDAPDPDDSPSSYAFYTIYVDTTNQRTHVIFDVNPTITKVPEDGEFVGKYVKLSDFEESESKFVERSYMRVAEHYDRGPVFYQQNIYDKDDNFYESRKLEFVLEGIYPKRTQNIGGVDTPLFVEVGDDYYYPHPDGPARISIPLFGESNGKRDKIKLLDISSDGYVVKSSMFNPYGHEETVVVIHQSPSDYLTEDSLSGYYLGDRNTGKRYRIYNSKLLTSAYGFYLPSLYGYGYGYGYGTGLDYFDVFSLQGSGVGYGVSDFELAFTNDYGFGYGYEQTNVGGTYQLALRLENLDAAGDGGLNYVDDPYNTWYRFAFTEMHESNGLALYQTDTEGETQFLGIVGTGEITNSDIFESGQSQAVIEVTWPTIPEEYKLYNGLVGRYIGNNETQIRHLISGSIWNESQDKLTLRIQLYRNPKNSNLSIYSDGAISSVTSNTVTLTRSLGLTANSLKGTYLYVNDRYWRGFQILSNTTDTITLDTSGFNSLVNVSADLVNYRTSIPSRDTLDLVIDQSNQNVYTISRDGIFYSNDSGSNWRSIINGSNASGVIDIDGVSGIPLVSFTSLSISSNILYVSSNTGSNLGGVYSYNILLDTWEKIGGNSSDVLYGKKVEEIDVYEDSDQIVIYAGTSLNGPYKGVYNKVGMSWTWTNIYLPENTIKAVDAVSDQDAIKDLDRVWIGTDGKGVLFREEADEEWSDFSNANSFVEEIQSAFWRIWDVEQDGDNVLASVLFREKEQNRRDLKTYKFSQIDVPEFDDETFEWGSKVLEGGHKDRAFMYAIDPSNIDYFLHTIQPHIVSQGSPSYHKFSNFITMLNGSQRIYDNFGNSGLYIGAGVVQNSSDIFSATNFYEEPFSHYPNMSAISVIHQTNSGNILIGTDRNGIYKSGSTGDHYILPIPSGDHSVSFGYTFFDSKFTDGSGVGTPSRKFFDGINSFPEVYNKVEKTWEYVIPDSGSFDQDAYDDISSLSNIQDLVGSYFLVSQDMNEYQGPVENTERYRVYKILEIENRTNTLQGYDEHVLTLSAGQISLSQSDQDRIESAFERFDPAYEYVDNTYTKWCIIDFESYTSINGGLPTSSAKDSKGNNEIACLIRDIDSKVDGSAAIACGIQGVYSVSDIDATSISWTKENINVDSTSLVYSGAGDLYVGTWGDGVWTNKGGPWVQLSGMNHFNVWAVFAESTGTYLYIGTEHGGIYRWHLTNETMERMTDGVVRSQIFAWKTESVPVQNGVELDYSNSDYILAYSWGGGIVRSRNRGLSWENVNNGLKNLYIQDISICSTDKNVVYAATYGGGVFRSENIFNTDIPTWYPCSQNELPSTLNVDEVEVGTNPEIAYIKTRENDISLKGVPYRFRSLSGRKLVPRPYDIDTTEYEYGSLRSNNVYLPLTPYSKGNRRHSVYRTGDGGIAWTKVFDKTPTSSDDFTMTSSIYGLAIVPGTSDTVKFFSSFKRNVRDGEDFNFVERFDFVTLVSGVIQSEVSVDDSLELPYGGGLRPESAFGDAFISINPDNVSEIIVTIIHSRNILLSSRLASPYLIKSSDGGATWESHVSWIERSPASPLSTEFANRAQFSTVDNDTETVVLASDTSSFTIQGTISDAYEENYFWNKARKYFENTSNRNFFVNARFSQQGTNANLFTNSPREEPAGIIGGRRPVYLTGTEITPDIVSRPNSSFTVSGGGIKDFLSYPESDGIITSTLTLADEYDKETLRLNTPVTTCRLSNLTSILFELSSLGANSMLRQENALVGVNINVVGSNTSYPIAVHRIYNDGGVDYVQILVVGSLVASSGTSIEINPDRSIYVNLYNNILTSINGGLTWKHVDVTGQFKNPSVSLLALVSFPVSNISDSDIVRRTYVIVEKDGTSKLYSGDVEDGRYDGLSINDIQWTLVPGSYTGVIDNGLSVAVLSASEQYIYVSYSDKITRIKIENGSIGATQTMVDSSSVDGDLNVQHPIVVSEANPQLMAFVANDRIFTTTDGFVSVTTTSDLDFSGDAVDKLVLDNTNQDDVYLCVNNGQIRIYKTAPSVGVFEAENNNIFGVTERFNTFRDFSDKWEGKVLSIEENGTQKQYTTKIKDVNNDSVRVSNTISGEIISADYDPVFGKTRINLKATFAIEDAIEDYVGNIVTFQDAPLSQVFFYEKSIEELNVVDALNMELVVSGDITDQFSDRSINFSTKKAYFRIGRLLDFIGRSFSGNISSSRISESSEINGLWFSNTFGNGFERLDDLVYGEDDRPGCLGLYDFSNGAKTAVLTDNENTRFFVNDSWLPSENIKYIGLNVDNEIVLGTDSGISVASISETSKVDFSNYYFNDFEKIFTLSGDRLFLHDSDSNSYIIPKPTFDFYGSEELEPLPFISDVVNKVIEDDNGIIWIATANSGVYAISGFNVNIYDTDTSGIADNTIKDIFENSDGRIWFCFGNQGVGFADYVVVNNEIQNILFTNYDSEDGITGDVTGVYEKNGITYESNGTVSTPVIEVQWPNNSIVKNQSLIIRSQSDATPIVDDLSFTINPVTGTIASVVEETINDIVYWKITASTLTSSTITDFGEDTFVGKTILINARENEDLRTIALNSGVDFYIVKDDSEDAPVVGKYFMICDKVPGLDAFVVYQGDGSNVSFTLSDTSIVNNSTYYYYLYFYASGDTDYQQIDSKQIQVSSSQSISETLENMIFVGGDGIFDFNPNRNPKFSILINLGEIDIPTSTFVDSNNSIWIAAGSQLINVVGSSQFNYDKDLMFADNDNVSSGSIEVFNILEEENGNIYVSTNLGLVSFRTDDSIISYVGNDDKREFSNDTWRPVKVLGGNRSKAIFANSNSSNSAYLLGDRYLYETNNTSLRWDRVAEVSVDYKFFVESWDESGDINDYVFSNDFTIVSSLSDNLTFENFASINENLPRLNGSSNIVPFHISLSENQTDKVLFAGLISHDVVYTEREVARITFPSNIIVGTISYLGSSDGISIQSIYDFTELIDGGTRTIFAGGKDNILSLENNGSEWSVVPFDGQSLGSPQFAYTALSVRKDTSAIEHSSGTVIYASRTPLYGERAYEIGSDSYLVAIRYGESSNIVNRIEVSNGLIKDLIPQVDKPAFSAYDLQAGNQYFIYNHFSGNKGSILFLDSQKTLLVGGFDNKIAVIPFTAEKESILSKKNVSVYSSRRSISDTAFPIYDHNYFINVSIIPILFSGWSRSRPTLADFRIRPNSEWKIKFHSENELEGYLSSILFGSNTDNPYNLYEYASLTNFAWMHTTKDGGMTWQYFVKDGYPTALVSDMVIDDAEFIASSILGTGPNNVGAFEYNFNTSSWEEDFTSDVPKMPVKLMERVSTDIFSGPLGHGLYRVAEGSYGYGYGYGGDETLDYFNVFSVSGSNYGYAFNQTDFSYGYGYGFEIVEGWEKVVSIPNTEKGLNFGKWKVSKIVEDPNDKNRVVVATEESGIIEGVYSNSQWSWSLDNDGLPSGNISTFDVLRTNSYTILLGIQGSGDNNGLYRKVSETSRYQKITGTSVPDNAIVKDILIDTNITDVVATLNVSNADADTIMIVRSLFEVSNESPQDGIIYVVGNEIGNAKVVYVGTDDFTTEAFEDSSVELKAGLPYYYKIYIRSGGNYTEKGTISAQASLIDPLGVTVAGTPYSNKSLAGRVVKIKNNRNINSLRFEIVENTDSSLSLTRDPFKVLNFGDARKIGGNEATVIVESTLKSIPESINPIYIVAENPDDNIARVYVSVDNGVNWSLTNTGIDSSVNSITFVPKETSETILQTVLYSANVDGVFKSTDSGATWTRISTGSNGLPDSISYHSILVDLEDTTIVYAIAGNGNIYRTTNNGVSWDSINSISATINDTGIVSYFTNSLYFALTNEGIKRINDSVRETIEVSIETDGRITFFDVDHMELGDSFTTDANSILAKTLSKNDSASDTREQIVLKISDATRYLTFKFRNSLGLFDKEDIYVGDDSTNAFGNPLLLESPTYPQPNIVVNKIGSLSAGEQYVLTNKGMYLTTDAGEKWDKINSALIPDGILDVSSTKDGEILLGTTEKGLWISKEERRVFRNVEQNGNDVNTILETNIGGSRRLYRGGNDGLYVTISNPIGRTIVVYSGPSFDGGSSVEFSWGELIGTNDGNWSDGTTRRLDNPTIAYDGVNWGEYDGWDEALIVRRGPFSTLEKAENAALANDVFAPLNNIMYPSVRTNDDSFVYSGSSSDYEEFRDQNLQGGSSVGVSFNPRAFFSDGSIIIGRLKNPSSTYPSTGNGPTPDKPIIDRVQPLTGSSRDAESMGINIADSDAYESGTADNQLAPVLVAGKYYIYRIYPYRMVPASDVIAGNGTRPLFPRYIPEVGDLVDEYTSIIDIKKFSGASRINILISTNDGNWAAGTDAGLYYSTENGMNAIRTDNDGLKREVTSMIYTSGGTFIVSVLGTTGLEVYRNTRNVTDSNFDDGWSFATGISNAMNFAGANMINNFIEDESGNIYANTNKGILVGNSNGTGWKRANSVGHVESLNDGKILAQEFRVT